MSIPKIQFALNCWQSPITLTKVTSTIVDYVKVTNNTDITFKGVIQPLTPEALKLKPLETRSWKWLMIHTGIDAEIETNDLLEYEGEQFKVMFKNDYSLNNYFEYHLVKNYD
tara:strand:+ start:268 stop:603 length:336 start_codon:yes stop_codon:yes gene_type:complete